MKKSGLAFLTVWFFQQPGKELINREFSTDNTNKDSNVMFRIADEIRDSAQTSLLGQKDDKLAQKLTTYTQKFF